MDRPVNATTNQQFEEFLQAVQEQQRQTLGQKGSEYAPKGFRFDIFYGAAALDGETDAIDEAWGFMKKHFVSVKDIFVMHREDHSHIPSAAYINEKFGDIRNYLIIAEQLFNEARERLPQKGA